MEVHLDSEEAAMAQRDRKGKRRPQGRTATPPAEVAARTGQILTEREAEWLDRLARDPASFAAVEREVHDQARHQADLYVAGLLAKASERPEMAEHIAGVTAAAEVPLRPVEKKKRPLVVRLLGGLAITVMTLYCSPRARTGKRRGREGGGLYPELAAYRISEGSSPNVQAAVGRQVALLPIEQARGELARHGLELDEKAVRRIAHELGAQMLASRTRDLLRFRRGECPAGEEFKGKRVVVAIDGGRVRVRTVIKKVRIAGKIKRQPFKVEWREPKLVIIFETDAQGRMAKGCRPLIDGTLRGPDALIELVAFHLHRLGAAQAKVVTFTADGAPWIWARLDWVVAQIKLEPAQRGRSSGRVPRGASPEPGLAGVGPVRGGAGPGVRPAPPVAQGGLEPGCDQGTGGPGGGPARGLGGVARDRLLDPALGGGPAAVRLLPVSGRAAGERGD